MRKNILQQDVLGPEIIPEFQLKALDSSRPSIQNKILLYRRALTPAPFSLWDAEKFRVPLIPHIDDQETEKEFWRFISSCIPQLNIRKVGMRSGLLQADAFLGSHLNSSIHNILHSHDLRDELDACYRYVGRGKVMELLGTKCRRTILAFPKPSLAGTVCHKKEPLARYGMFLNADNIFAFTID